LFPHRCGSSVREAGDVLDPAQPVLGRDGSCCFRQGRQRTKGDGIQDAGDPAQLDEVADDLVGAAVFEDGTIADHVAGKVSGKKADGNLHREERAHGGATLWGSSYLVTAAVASTAAALKFVLKFSEFADVDQL